MDQIFILPCHDYFSEFLDDTIGLEYNPYASIFGSRYYPEDVDEWFQHHYKIDLGLAATFT